MLPGAEGPGLVPMEAPVVPVELPAVLESDVGPVVFAPASVTLFCTWWVALSQHCVFAPPALVESAVLEPELVCVAAELTAPAKSATANAAVGPEMRMDVSPCWCINNGAVIVSRAC